MPDGAHGDHPDLATGFSEVDAQPDAAYLVAAMDATALWPAVQQLRAWEREHLALRPGDRLLDVGCGLGDAAMALAGDVQPGGAVVGVDASEAMLAVARERAAAGGLAVDFHVADAMAIDQPDASFDACRSERMLQWVPDVELAIAEMVRVLRPGGRLSLIDTDWRTIAADVPDVDAWEVVRAALLASRGGAAAAGGRLLNLCRERGLEGIASTAASHLWTAWDPDHEPGPSGLFPLRSAVPQLVEMGLLDASVAARFVADVVDAARRDRTCISVTMIAVTGRRP